MKKKFLLSIFVFIVIISTCSRSTDLDTIVRSSLKKAVKQYIALDKTVPDSLFPRTLNSDGSVQTNRSDWWTSGFFPGSLWYLYEFSGHPKLKERARFRTRTVEREKWNNRDHDIGFKIFCSFGNGWRLTMDTSYIPVIITAAKTLTTRFDADVGCIQSWGENLERGWKYPVIIDNMMNLELLFWAAKQTGDSSFFKVAVSHADKTLANHFRQDGSSYHVLSYHPETGAVEKKNTAQGYSDESVWARGQAWGLYGFTMSYRETGYPRYLQKAREIADFILNHPNFPEDKIPYWDFNAPDIPNALRDASAAAIMASALLELKSYVNPELSAFYECSAEQILWSLSSESYRSALGKNGNFLLMRGVGNIPSNSEVDVPLSYADYYYIEAIMRYLKSISMNI
ncbi:glycoside hydrolase family 88 protein [bacterium]|nr:glycoside hydrolase family 88 protein [bacterium]